MESTTAAQAAIHGLAFLRELLGFDWPWRFVVGTLGLAVLLVLLAKGWDWLLGQPWGGCWPVLAAILPAFIPLARILEETPPGVLQLSTVGVLLVAIAVVQLYGQERNKRDRIKTEDRINEQTAILDSLLVEIAKYGIILSRIADGVASEEEEGEEG